MVPGLHFENVNTNFNTSTNTIVFIKENTFENVICIMVTLLFRPECVYCFIHTTGVLFYCISPTERHARCLEISLTYGADVNNKSKDGTPVFLKACDSASENEDMCLALLKKGADPNSKHEVTVDEVDLGATSQYMYKKSFQVWVVPL